VCGRYLTPLTMKRRASDSKLPLHIFSNYNTIHVTNIKIGLIVMLVKILFEFLPIPLRELRNSICGHGGEGNSMACGICALTSP